MKLYKLISKLRYKSAKRRERRSILCIMIELDAIQEEMLKRDDFIKPSAYMSVDEMIEHRTMTYKEFIGRLEWYSEGDGISGGECALTMSDLKELSLSKLYEIELMMMTITTEMAV